MNSSEFMLNNQVYTQKQREWMQEGKHNRKRQHKNSRAQREAIINFYPRKEAYNFVLFINVEIMRQNALFRGTSSADVCGAGVDTAIKMQEQNSRHTICIII